LRRGFLQTDLAKRPPQIGQSPNHPDVSSLARLQRCLFDRVRRPKSPSDLFRDTDLKSQVGAMAINLETALQEKHLIASPEMRRRARSAGLTAISLFLGLGTYKLVVALDKGRHNVAFLIILAVVGLIALLIAAWPQRLTALGKAYVERLQSTFDSLRHFPDPKSNPTVADSSLRLGVALFGITILAGGPFDAMTTIFRRSANAAGHCGGGCGSSGCGGGGGGCGGGGCGGGGCGGCGGGG
jgi:uncharacterized protein (TIGR04222 family)